MEICLPDSKLRELQHLINEWQDKKSSTEKELESLVGKLVFATIKGSEAWKNFSSTYVRASFRNSATPSSCSIKCTVPVRLALVGDIPSRMERGVHVGGAIIDNSLCDRRIRTIWVQSTVERKWFQLQWPQSY